MLSELKLRQGGGKGMMLIDLKEGDKLTGCTVVNQPAVTLSGTAGSKVQQVKIDGKGLQMYFGARAGKVIPRLAFTMRVSRFPKQLSMTEPVRLAKRLAALASCSRREAELYIAGGWVSVDGVVVEEPQFMVGEQKIVLHPDAMLAPVAPITSLYHQPASGSGSEREFHPIFLDSARAANDRSGARLLKQHFVRLQQCLALEPQAGGLAVFSQDYRVLRKLGDGAGSIEQEFVVKVGGEVHADGLATLNRGLVFHGKALPATKISWQNESHLRFALKGVLPGQIAFMCRSVGLEVVEIKRLRIGRLPLGKLPPGQWRYLMPYEKF